MPTQGFGFATLQTKAAEAEKAIAAKAIVKRVSFNSCVNACYMMCWNHAHTLSTGDTESSFWAHQCESLLRVVVRPI